VFLRANRSMDNAFLEAFGLATALKGLNSAKQYRKN
jgi:hypothetical protein